MLNFTIIPLDHPLLVTRTELSPPIIISLQVIIIFPVLKFCNLALKLPFFKCELTKKSLFVCTAVYATLFLFYYNGRPDLLNLLDL